MIIYKRGDSLNFNTSIQTIDHNYLRLIEEELNKTGLLFEAEELVRSLNVKKDNVNNFESTSGIDASNPQV